MVKQESAILKWRPACFLSSTAHQTSLPHLTKKQVGGDGKQENVTDPPIKHFHHDHSQSQRLDHLADP